MPVTVLQSTVADGSMYNRDDLLDASVIENRRNFLSKANIAPEQTTLFLMRFIGEDASYCKYSIVDDTHKGQGIADDQPLTHDALITTTPNHALMLPVADCIAATIYDPIKKVLMLSHLGRHSLEQQGGKKSVEFLVDTFGTNPADLQVWLSATAGKDVYTIWALDNKGMKEAAFEQLQSAGIIDANITDNPDETTSDERYFSYSEYLKGNRTSHGDHCMVAMMTD